MKKELITLLKAVGITAIFCILIAVSVAVMLRLGVWASQRAYIYRLIAMTIGICLLLCIVFAGIGTRRESIFGVGYATNVMCVGLAGLFMCLFFTLGPMTIERSYSIYSLAYMTDYDEICGYEEIRDQFITGYVDGGATKMRIEEQVSIGNLKKIGDKYEITKKGKSLIKLLRVVEAVFPVPDTGSIYPEKIDNLGVSNP